MKTRFILVRHGESQANLENRFAGQIDIPLTETGRKQAECTGEYLKNEKIDVFYSSLLSRAYETACTVAKHHNLPVTKIAGLNEINGGEWENKSYPEIEKFFPDNYNVWNTIIGLTQCNGGENVEQVQQRVYSAIEKIAEENKGKTVFIGFHGMSLRSFLCKVLNLSLDQMHTESTWASNASITYVDYENGKFTLIEHSYDQHLSDKGLRTTLKLKA